jgi:hypothetical protein
MERGEDRLPCLSVVEMSAGGAESRWRGRHGGEGGHRGGMAERGRGVLSWCCGEVSFFRTITGQVDEQIRGSR